METPETDFRVEIHDLNHGPAVSATLAEAQDGAERRAQHVSSGMAEIVQYRRSDGAEHDRRLASKEDVDAALALGALDKRK